MIFRCNTTISILTSTTTEDAYGDPEDNETVTASGIPASIIEQSVDAQTEVGTMPRVVRFATGRVSTGYALSLTENNRIMDEKTGRIYTISNVSNIGQPIGYGALRLELESTN